MTTSLTPADKSTAQRLIAHWLQYATNPDKTLVARYARHLETQASRADLHSFVDDDYGSEFCKTCGHSIIGHEDGPISRAEPSKGDAEGDAEKAHELALAVKAYGIKDGTQQIAQALNAAKRNARAEALEEAIDALPETAEDPNESGYERGRFNGVMEYQKAIRALAAKEEA